MPGETWAPALADVARHIPTRTRDTSPGSDALLGTFTEATTPTREQAQAELDAAVWGLVAEVGALPDSGPADWLEHVQAAARTYCEWRAAADIELAYPGRDADVRVAAQLDARAKDALATFKTILAEAGSGLVATGPAWAFPDPEPLTYDNPLY